MKIEELQKGLLQMNYNELTEKVRRIREGRVMPAPKAKIKTAKRARKTEDSLQEMFNKMSLSEKEAFIGKLES